MVTCDQEAPDICQAVLTAVDMESSQAAVWTQEKALADRLLHAWRKSEGVCTLGLTSVAAARTSPMPTSPAPTLRIEVK